jgi:hypothetical protein
LQDFKLKSTLALFGQQQCEDSRDKVYGLMSLVKEQERVIVDYSKSIEEVFVDLAVTARKSEESWDFRFYSVPSPRIELWLLDFLEWVGLDEHRTALMMFTKSLNDTSPADIVGYGFCNRTSGGNGPVWWYSTGDRDLEFTRSGHEQ